MQLQRVHLVFFSLLGLGQSFLVSSTAAFHGSIHNLFQNPGHHTCVSAFGRNNGHQFSIDSAWRRMPSDHSMTTAGRSLAGKARDVVTRPGHKRKTVFGVGHLSRLSSICRAASPSAFASATSLDTAIDSNHRPFSMGKYACARDCLLALWVGYQMGSLCLSCPATSHWRESNRPWRTL